MALIPGRDIRQSKIIPSELLRKSHVAVIGVGAIGRQAALQLAAMGIGELTLVDFDVVEVVNLAPQGFMEKDLGKMKVDAVAKMCAQINSEVSIYKHAVAFTPDIIADATVVFSCVDSIDVRRDIWESVKDKNVTFIDSRMIGEVMRVITAFDDGSRKHYPTTLFNAEDAYASPCSAKSTIYCASMAAAFMVSKMTMVLRHMLVQWDASINLLAGELTVEAQSGQYER